MLAHARSLRASFVSGNRMVGKGAVLTISEGGSMLENCYTGVFVLFFELCTGSDPKWCRFRACISELAPKTAPA